MSWPPHITVATVIETGGQFLLVEELEAGKRVVNQPAGHLEPGETLFEAAVRETREETGWNCELTGVVGIYQHLAPHNDVLYHRIAFSARLLTETGTALDPDILGTVLISREDLDRYETRSPLVTRCIDDYLARGTWPLSLIQHIDSH